MGKEAVEEETIFEKRLDELAIVLYDEKGKEIAQKVMEENGFYENFTPEKFIDTFIGYTIVLAAKREYKPKTAEEMFLIQDSKKFATYIMQETGIDLESCFNEHRVH
ncbi:hypothetical protein KY342_00890 [Candidatus Woesearchaeota archaeon]|nr:hypothetical protein [Candidatus Woesearchaeota archaeon]